MTLAVRSSSVLAAYEIGSASPINDQADEDLAGSLFDVEINFFDGYLSGPLHTIWERRKVSPPKLPTETDNTLWYSILQTVQEHDTCMSMRSRRYSP